VARYPKRPSRIDIRNQRAWLQSIATGEPATFEASVKRGRQPEADTNDAIAKWRRLKPGLVLERNKKRLATPPGMTQPIMLGWLAPGSPDWVGYRPLLITPEMVGRTVAQFVGLESKRPKGGTLSADQEAFLNALKDAGGCCGVVRSAEDADVIYSQR
jgi:hypothetical protein